MQLSENYPLVRLASAIDENDDISIVKDGVTYQPTDKVKVKVELLESAAQSVSDVKVVHFGENEGYIRRKLLRHSKTLR